MILFCFGRLIFRLYTRSECTLDCRVKDVIEVCGCLPVPFAELYDAPDCLLDDLKCLSIWTGQWIQSRSGTGAGAGKPSQPKCSHCLQRCSFIEYIPATSKAAFDPANQSRMSDPDHFLCVSFRRFPFSFINQNSNQFAFPTRARKEIKST